MNLMESDSSYFVKSVSLCKSSLWCGGASSSTDSHGVLRKSFSIARRLKDQSQFLNTLLCSCGLQNRSIASAVGGGGEREGDFKSMSFFEFLGFGFLGVGEEKNSE
ncbi:hypothetical protein O6H91_08G053300 [Diphasiastrum complanatum]|uniref:Uncharacterized protein n=1 Tax=Diphasiastrum complanatum TaxID=34168 RepID=A0ACC2CXW5_DIPCM|nr:hypothetical protein O6H91_08G053300 [Diphasiastrum complanatum]